MKGPKIGTVLALGLMTSAMLAACSRSEGQGGDGNGGSGGAGATAGTGASGGTGGAAGAGVGGSNPQASLGYWVIASGGDFGDGIAIDTLALDGTGRLTPTSQIRKAGLPMVMQPSWVTAGPTNRVVYVADENYGANGQVLAFTIDGKTGVLALANARSADGQGTVHIAVDQAGKFLVAPNFANGTVQVYAIEADGKVGGATDTKPGKRRQRFASQKLATHLWQVEFTHC